MTTVPGSLFRATAAGGAAGVDAGGADDTGDAGDAGVAPAAAGAAAAPVAGAVEGVVVVAGVDDDVVASVDEATVVDAARPGP